MENFVKNYSQFISEADRPGPETYYKGLSKSTSDKRAAQIKKQSKMSDDDPDAYKELPGDSKETKPSKHTKKFAELFSESSEHILTEKLSDEIETGLKNKLEKIKEKNPEKYKDVTLGILRQVMKNGMAAWKSGHKPGAGQVQWGYARVNSFLTGGPTIGTSKEPGPDGKLGKKAGLI